MNWSERKGLSQQGRDRDTDRGNEKNGERKEKQASSLLAVHVARSQRVRGAEEKEPSYIRTPDARFNSAGREGGRGLWGGGRISPTSCCQVAFVAMRVRTKQRPCSARNVPDGCGSRQRRSTAAGQAHRRYRLTGEPRPTARPRERRWGAGGAGAEALLAAQSAQILL